MRMALVFVTTSLSVRHSCKRVPTVLVSDKYTEVLDLHFRRPIGVSFRHCNFSPHFFLFFFLTSLSKFPLSYYPFPPPPFPLSHPAVSAHPSVFEGEVPRVEAGPRQGAEHLRPVRGSGGQQGLHAGSDVLQVGATHLRDRRTDTGTDFSDAAAHNTVVDGARHSQM